MLSSNLPIPLSRCYKKKVQEVAPCQRIYQVKVQICQAGCCWPELSWQHTVSTKLSGRTSRCHNQYGSDQIETSAFRCSSSCPFYFSCHFQSLPRSSTRFRLSSVRQAKKRTGVFGWCVSGIPDLTGDGLDDLIVRGEGRGHIFDGASGTWVQTVVSPSGAFRALGTTHHNLSGIPDWDGDGIGDVIGGDVPYDGSSPAAYIFSGENGDLLHTLTSPSNDTGGAFGVSVAGIQDLNGDGFGDVLVGAPGEDVEGLSGGGARPMSFPKHAAITFAHTCPPRIQKVRKISATASPPCRTWMPTVAKIFLSVLMLRRVLVVSISLAGRPACLCLCLSCLRPQPRYHRSKFGHQTSGIPDITGDSVAEVVVGNFGNR